MKLFRPVGLKELMLILETDGQKFPPRLNWQPIFYPVLNFEYARQIAYEWNVNDEGSGYAGFVTEFEVNDLYISRFEVQTVGNAIHQELWIPAEELESFNSQIVDKIRIKVAFLHPDHYKGPALADLGEKYPGMFEL